MPRNEQFKLSIVVPMYFEQEVARECHRRLTEALTGRFDYEIIYVNDGSTDDTLPILRELAAADEHVRVISFSRNFGHQAAVTAGTRAAAGDAVVIIDADLQDPPELIPDMVRLWQDGWDVVYAKRAKRKGESPFKLLTAKLFYRFLRLMTDTRIPEDTGDFRLMDRRVVAAFGKMPEHNRFIRGMVAWLGFRQTPILYERDERYAGVTKYPLRRMLKFAADGILSFSTRPLRIMIQLGGLSLLVALGILIYALVVRLTGRALSPGWASVMVTITFLGGIELLSLGVLGAYIGRIYAESQNRPLYLVAETIRVDEEKLQ